MKKVYKLSLYPWILRTTDSNISSLPPESDICGCKKMDCREQWIILYSSDKYTISNDILQNDKIDNLNKKKYVEATS